MCKYVQPIEMIIWKPFWGDTGHLCMTRVIIIACIGSKPIHSLVSIRSAGSSASSHSPTPPPPPKKSYLKKKTNISKLANKWCFLFKMFRFRDRLCDDPFFVFAARPSQVYALLSPINLRTWGYLVMASNKELLPQKVRKMTLKQSLLLMWFIFWSSTIAIELPYFRNLEQCFL